ncbi:MAG: site-2 protease family protein [Chloroflexota bacterium]
MGTKGVLKIARIGGIDIKLHWSWALILLLVTYQLGAGYFPVMIPDESALFYWVLGLLASILFFVSVLLHELSHSFMARARGYKVNDIVLFIFGGVSNIDEEPKKASDEFLIAVVGPLTSLLIAAVCFGLLLIITPPVRRAGAGAAATLQYLALINALLGLFNMIPGFPLDGGRVLRSIVWGINHNYQTATRIAGSIGQLVAYGFIFWGLYQTFFSGDFSGLWIAFIGWFLLNAAQQSVSGVAMKEAFRGATVGQAMEAAPPTIQPQSTLAHLLSSYILPYNLRAVPVADQNGQLVGIITLGDIKEVPQDQWGTVTVGELMTGPDKLRVVRPNDGLDKAMQFLSEGDFDQLPVVDTTGRLAGILTRAHLIRWLQIRDELHVGTSGAA